MRGNLWKNLFAVILGSPKVFYLRAELLKFLHGRPSDPLWFG